MRRQLPHLPFGSRYAAAGVLARRWAAGTGPTAVDLFAGAGLLSYAFRSAGFRIQQAVESDPVGAATYAANIDSQVQVADVRRVQPEGRCDVLIAGPPCQGFSTLGRRDLCDPRNQLSLEVVRWARRMQPAVAVIENVAPFLQSQIWEQLAAQLRQLDYDVGAFVLRATDFGVPQVRARSFTFASRRGLPMFRPGQQATMTVREAWDGLPSKPDGRNNHFAPVPSPLALARMRCIPEGGDKRDIMRAAPHLAPPSWWRTTYEVTDVWGRMTWDSPSNTLRTCLYNPSKGRYIHPRQHRVISLREAARLQTIPDSFSFVGLHTQVARQIGNAVPPVLGRAVALAVLKLLG